MVDAGHEFVGSVLEVFGGLAGGDENRFLNVQLELF